MLLFLILSSFAIIVCNMLVSPSLLNYIEIASLKYQIKVIENIEDSRKRKCI